MEILVRNYLTRGFWGDEAWTALISQFPITDILKITGQDFHPPAYYLLVHGFIRLFGASEWIRLISVGFWMATPVAVYVLVRQLMSKRVAIMTAALVALNPLLFRYAFEARAYAMVVFLSVASTLVFWKRKWWGYWIIGSIAVYSHYYMWFILAAHGVYWLVMDRKKIWQVCLAFGGILAVQLPWLPTLLAQVGSVAADYWIAPIDKRTHWEFFMRIAGGDYATPQQMAAVWLGLGLLIASLITVRLRMKTYPRGYVMLWLWLVVPVVIPTLLSVYRPVFFYRYLIFSAIPILALCVWGVEAMGRKAAYGLLMVLAGIYVSINILSFMRYPYSMREELEAKTGKLVTVLPSFVEVKYYSRGREVQVLPLGIVEFSGKSLLDAFVAKGEVKIQEPEANESYWLIEPGPKSQFYENIQTDK